jgi:hypothetical protein
VTVSREGMAGKKTGLTWHSLAAAASAMVRIEVKMMKRIWMVVSYVL